MSSTVLSQVSYYFCFLHNQAKKLTIQIGPSQMTLFSPDTITLRSFLLELVGKGLMIKGGGLMIKGGGLMIKGGGRMIKGGG